MFLIEFEIDVLACSYTWLLWRQPANFDQQTYFTPITTPITDPTPAQIAQVANFNISAFAEATGLGEPIGGSFAMIAPPS